MNKNIKRLIAMALTIGAFSALGQTNDGFFITKAYASTTDADELKEIEIATSKGDNLELYTDGDYVDKLTGDLEVNETYFVKTSERIVVIEGIDGVDNDNVRIFKNNFDTAYKVDEEISIALNRVTTLKVRVYENDYDEDKVYSSDDYNQYNIKIKNITSEEDQDDEEDKGSDENNGLHLGWRNKNKNGNNGLHLGWRNQNGLWNYIDNEGQMKKGWFKDVDESWYFLDNNGNMKIGWFKDAEGNWYFLGSNGKMKTNWLKDADGNWYYLYPSGKMAKNTIVDGYKLGDNGAWTKN